MSEATATVLAETLHQRGGRVTPQRLAIARLVGELDRHLTAEEIHRELTARIPGVSMPTIYATLELLEELGQVRRVPGSPGAALFDTRTDPHDHMICRRCGRVSDLDVATDHTPALSAAAARGFAAENVQLTVTGLCARCRPQPAEPANRGRGRA